MSLTVIKNEISAPITLGRKGDDGDSAYEIAVDNGFTGNLSEWLDSLQGPAGTGNFEEIEESINIVSGNLSDFELETATATGSLDSRLSTAESDIGNLESATGVLNSGLSEALTSSDINTLPELNAILNDATLIDTGDARLSDARTPTAHTHTLSEISDAGTAAAAATGDFATAAQGTLATTAVQPAGNVATATALATGREINGAVFDGTQNITVTADAGTLTGSTLNATVTGSSLTSVGTIGTGVWQGTAIADAYIASAATWNAQGALADSAVQEGDSPSFVDLTASGTVTGGAGSFTTLTASGIGTISNSLNVAYSVTCGTGTTAYYKWLHKSAMGSAVDGNITFYNAALNDFGRLSFGGNTSSFPAIKRNGTAINIRLADDSSDADLTCSNLTASGTVTAAGLTTTGNVGIGVPNPLANLDILTTNNAAGGIRMQSSLIDSTNKNARFKVGHYNNSEEPVTVFNVTSTGGAAEIHFGGGSSVENAATSLMFFTAGNNTTLAGSERLRIWYNGNVGIGTTAPSEKLEVVGNIKSSGTVTAGTVKTGSYTVATLPTPSTGMRAQVTDSNRPAQTHFGSPVIAAGGGTAYTVPVFYDGTNWIIA